MLRIALCDDMKDFLVSTRDMIQQWDKKPQNMSIDFFSDGDSLIEAHTAKPFDIIFMDILMPLLNGIEAASEIRKHDKSVKIVFLTSTSDFAVASYTVSANNYLLKPIEQDKLLSCLDTLYSDILANAKCITVRSPSAVHRIGLHTIEYIEAQGKKVSFALTDSTTVESNNPFYYFENQLLLEDGFFKCHRSYIVNINKIKTYTQKEIKMQSGFRIPIARSCHAEFESAYFKLLFNEAEVTEDV